MIRNFLCRTTLLIVFMCFSTISFADVVWIDVRSSFEHAIDSIEGDIRISHDNIVAGVNKLLLDENTDIRLYCRSGARSNNAMLALKEAGYKNVSNGGGITDARKYRGLKR